MDETTLTRDEFDAFIEEVMRPRPWWYRLPGRIRTWYLDKKDDIKYAIQRMRHGYDDRSKWGLNTQLLQHIKFGIEGMLEYKNSHPIDFENYEEWEQTLRAILDGIEAGIADEEESYWELKPNMTKEDWARIREQSEQLRHQRDTALILLVKYFDNLWD